MNQPPIVRANLVEREPLGNPGTYECGVIADHAIGIGSVLATCDTTGQSDLITREDTNPRTDTREWFTDFDLPEGLHTLRFRVTSIDGQEREVVHQVCVGAPEAFGWSVTEGEDIGGNGDIYYCDSFELLRGCDIDLTGIKYFNNDSRCVWFDDCVFFGHTAPANNQGAHVRPRVKNARAYATGCDYRNVYRPFSEHIIARNNTVDGVVSDVARNTLVVTGNTVTDLDGFADSDHTDFVQIFRDHSDVIIQDNRVRNVTGPVQILFIDGYVPAGDTGIHRNFLIRDNILEGPAIHPDVYAQSQFFLQCDNFVMRDNDIGQKFVFRTDGGFRTNGFKLERNIFRREVMQPRGVYQYPPNVEASQNIYCVAGNEAIGGGIPLSAIDLNNDGLATGADLQEQVNRWHAGDPRADTTTTGAAEGQPGYGVPDGQLTGTDLQWYVNHWRRLNAGQTAAGEGE